MLAVYQYGKARNYLLNEAILEKIGPFLSKFNYSQSNQMGQLTIDTVDTDKKLELLILHSDP